MFDANIYDWSRQRYAEYTLKYDRLYVPPGDKPGLFQRLLAALRKPVRRPSGQPQPTQVKTPALS